MCRAPCTVCLNRILNRRYFDLIYFCDFGGLIIKRKAYIHKKVRFE